MRACVPFRLAVPLAAASLLLVGSCATTGGWAPDRAAKGPQLQGFGGAAMQARTRSEEAARLFESAVLQAYAFNEAEAVRLFKAALARDPDCVLCAWGVAWQLGPTINDPGRGSLDEAVRHVDYAVRRLDAATPRERELVEALALRYAHASQARETAPLLGERCGKAPSAGEPHPLDVAYAERMRRLVDRYPDDPDLLTLYAEAEMIATPGDTAWTAAGAPVGRMGEVADRLERLLQRHPGHTGLNHYMTHSVDAPSVAVRALPAADRLGRLAPASPHLLHMPAHIYVWTGRLDDAVRVNQQALAAEDHLMGELKAQGFESLKDWRGHNAHFLWYAATMNGQHQAALDAAGQLVASLGDRNDGFAEYVRSLPLLTHVRFEDWPAALAHPAPAAGVGIAQAFWEHARGVALARTGRTAEARTTLESLRATVARVRGDKPESVPKRRLALVDYALARLQAEVNLAAGDAEGALASQREAVAAAASLDKLEPPWLADSALLALGDLQVQTRRWDAAEATFRQSQAERPGNVWAVKGLARVRAGRG